MSGTKDARITKVEDALRSSYEYCQPKMKDAYYAYENYLNKIDQRIWGTLSECPIPMAYSTVETMIPSIMDYLFGTPKPFGLLTPEGTGDAGLDKLEKYVYGKIFHEADLRHKIKPVLRDALIFPCAYAMVESRSITPPSAETAMVMDADGNFAAHQRLVPGPEIRVPSVRHIDFFSVFPSPVGTDPESADWIILIDFLDEFQVRDSIASGALAGDLGKMKKEAVDMMPYAETALHYATYMFDPDVPQLPTDRNIRNFNENLPVRIPVVKYYGKDEHIWISGSQVIYQSDSKETMACPIVRFCAQQISTTWYPQSIVEFAQDMYNLVNAWYNSIVDVLSHYLYPPTIVNKSMLMDQEQDISYQPNLMIETTGDPQRAIHYPQMPPIPPAMLDFPREMRSLLDSVNGVPEPVKGAGGVGIVRGGNNALQSLLARASARVVAVAEELEHSGMKPLYEKMLYKIQMIGGGKVSYLDSDNMKVYETVTQEEIRRAIGVQVMGKKQMENKFADQMTKIQAMPVLLQTGFDPVKVMRWAFPESDIDELAGQQPIQTPPPEQEGAGGMMPQGQARQSMGV